MNYGLLGLDFEDVKKLFKLPNDALLKNISVNRETGFIEISYYTTDANQTIPLETYSNTRSMRLKRLTFDS